MRREKISERMKFLQDLVPGCSKVSQWIKVSSRSFQFNFMNKVLLFQSIL